MWRKLATVLVVLPLAIVLVALAVANRAPVDLVLDPFGGRYAVAIPLFLLLFGTLALGLILGGFATWLGQSKWRKTARHRGREAYDLRRQAGRLERELEALQSQPQPPRLPAD